MSLYEIFRAVFTNLRANKFRVFLTALGIIVGSLTIILVVGIGRGSQASVEEQFAKLNAGTIYVMPSQGSTSRVALEPEDLLLIKDNAPSVAAATISVNGKASVSFYQSAYDSSVIGVLDDFQPLNNIVMTYGEFIRYGDSESKNRTAVLGSDLAELLFEGDASMAVGSTITIANRRFEVIGVMQRLGDATQGVNIDESVLIPYETAVKYVVGSDVKPRITALASDVDQVQGAINEIRSILYTQYGSDASDFQVRDAGSRLVVAQDSARTMSILLVSIAVIVLVVGGIGIMNVLFVSIKERTKEIGILKALGAKRRDILLQFLIESMLISTAGGLIGIALGFVAMPLMAYIEIRTIPSIYGNVLALFFSIATGTFFGYYPALKAASLRPIEALSYE
ncbi:ABC transporter permease [Acidaminobacter hydrogenoformans]|uniref:Putative ABC transport system permease protein n=1 Tax=Acidaminobacter hydrogenoformans DSM 2784 TaxID=1120920 RepID=A0A1G5S607_9FIRM|nr:ABC transporter permease [Acidaminobacter hydrogenoformans]SCZ81842.1 putative ABC transport system permease protein [Acidaminobacter hydrogenoformans DSM 2784]